MVVTAPYPHEKEVKKKGIETLTTWLVPQNPYEK